MNAPERINVSKAGFTFVDVMVAVVIVLASFTALYAVSAECMYVMNLGKELTSAQQVVQDRMEQMRNLQWTQVTDPNYLANNVFNQASTNSINLNGLTETVAIYAYSAAQASPTPTPTPSPTPITVTRSGGVVTPSAANSTIASGNLVRIDVTESWTAARTGLTRSVTNTTVQAKNSR